MQITNLLSKEFNDVTGLLQHFFSHDPSWKKNRAGSFYLKLDKVSMSVLIDCTYDLQTFFISFLFFSRFTGKSCLDLINARFADFNSFLGNFSIDFIPEGFYLDVFSWWEEEADWWIAILFSWLKSYVIQARRKTTIHEVIE